jgi:hypothetical protein
MNDQERVRALRTSNVDVANVLDEAADNLVACKDRVHGTERNFILQLARFLEGASFCPFPEEETPPEWKGEAGGGGGVPYR